MEQVFYVIVSWWLIFLFCHMIIGTILWYKDYKKSGKYLHYTDLAIIQIAFKKEMITIKKYAIICVIFAILTYLIICKFY